MKPEGSIPHPKNTAIYQTLRNKLLSLNPREVDIAATNEHPTVWGVMMETAYPEAGVTLAALVDGTTSLYFSTGGGILGSGNHPTVGIAARKMASIAEMALEFTQPVKEYPSPKTGNIRFYLLTFEGIHSAECPEMNLQSGKHSLSELYAAGQELISQIRMVSEKKKPG
ncbi:MAG: hypothetical protein WCF08_06120 [Anaerolineaceae bacterium]